MILPQTPQNASGVAYSFMSGGGFFRCLHLIVWLQWLYICVVTLKLHENEINSDRA